MQVQWVGQFAAGDVLLDTDIRDIEIVRIGDSTYLYTTTGSNGGLAAYQLASTGGPPQLIDTLHFPAWVAAAADGLLACLESSDGHDLMFGSTDSGALIGYSLDAQGQFAGFSQGDFLLSGTDQISDIACIDLGSGAQVVYVADGALAGITAYVPDGDSSYAPAPDTESTISALGPVQLATADNGTQSFLLAADPGSHGVTSYQVLSASGALAAVATAGAETGLGIATPTALEVVEAFGETYVVVGAAGSSSISVLRLTATGGLEPVEHLVDTLATRFGGLQSMSVVQSGDRVFVVAGGADDGLSLFTMLPGGQLVHLDTIVADGTMGLMNVQSLSASVVGEQVQVFAGSATTSGISQFAIDLSDLGDVVQGSGWLGGTGGDDLMEAVGTNTTLSGGDGDDILVAASAGVTLRGGAGADTFVVREQDGTVRIVDFRVGDDRLDLSGFSMLRNTGQLGFTATATGARLTFRDTVIEITSATGGPLSLSDLFGTGFDWPDRVLPVFAGLSLHGTDGRDTLTGSQFADTLDGADGGDLLIGDDGDDELLGRGGPDVLLGQDGNDLIVGGDGHDAIWAGSGADTASGGDGHDTLGGQDGDDMLWGEDGNDTVIGHEGDDQLWGGNGNDTLDGREGNDTLSGDGGLDSLVGGEGDDVLDGGPDADTLEGGYGNDSLVGGDGHDQLWGAAGDDTVSGGQGDDALGGFTGDDVFYGGTGNDTIWGHDGDDTAWGGDGDDLLNGWDGNDSLNGGSGDDDLWGGKGHDSLVGGDGADTLGGYLGADTLSGGMGDDALWGHLGNDILWGGDGNDLLAGYDGADTLNGGPGDDDLRPGAGNDILTGGEGADMFQFYGKVGVNHITDFEPGVDTIRVAGVAGFGALDMSEWGGNVYISLPGGTVVLDDTALSALDADDFLFG